MKNLIYILFVALTTSLCPAQEMEIQQPQIGTQPPDQQRTADIEIDVAREQDHTNMSSFLKQAQSCKARAAQIHYAFSHARLSLQPANCTLFVSISGELGEVNKPTRFVCDVQVLQQIDWLQSDAPIAELKSSEYCHSTGQ
ncbi:MAG TPA: hypothetical protein DDY14_07795 [Chromatiaceae bacterium]|jgi:hypothetical protein|nr:MAG: hypothetical protein N838_10690 [Thiohalocapsa sp. PB-PSB1]QQO56209.1 MAG: hypothetical protein N838_25460 [Thiohalocapsa sp. PB-PSB1]HBG95216.1 hypothetical protein [Chromatiaceae bacterium]HCS92001.1 hypothetical protein [Chromatiaceae bacterium]